MPGFFYPLWFIALAAIPLIRWLHRWQTTLSAWPVSAIFLWDQAVDVDAPGQKKQPPDPAWRRRALATALLITALAQPYWQQDVRSLTVWLDDSLSMLTLEENQTRLATAMQSLSRELDLGESRWREVELRSLGNPGLVRRYPDGTALNLDAWLSGELSEPVGPPTSLMSRDSTHWLLTDGASQGVQSWAQRAGIDRVIQVGSVTENSAVTRLAARRGLERAHSLDILVSISNTGHGADARRLEIVSDDQVLQTADLTIPPGQTIDWQTRLPAPGDSLTALLAPGDSLAADDGMTIGLERFKPLATRVDPDCEFALRHALATHPALQVSETGSNTVLHISCPQESYPILPNSAGPGAIARIRTLVAASQPVGASPSWSPHADFPQDVGLLPEWISAAPWPDGLPDSEHQVILSSADMPLVVAHRQAASGSTDAVASLIVDTVIDMRHAQFIRQPEFAAFVGALADIATQRYLLDETVSASRDPLASVVTPVPVDARSGPSVTSGRVTRTPLSSVFLIAALLVLSLDAVLLLRAIRGSKHA